MRTCQKEGRRANSIHVKYKAALIIISGKLLQRTTPSTGVGANSIHGQIVTNVGFYLGMLETNLNDSLIILRTANFTQVEIEFLLARRGE